MKCAAHPDVETNLTCSKCGKPICPKCMVQTPVGARCRECARLSNLPTYQVSSAHYLRASGAALMAAVILGLAWGFTASFIPFFYLNLFLASGIGYAISEVIGMSVNKKRGAGLAVIGAAAVVIAYLVNIFTFGHIPFGLFALALDGLAVIIGAGVAANALRRV